MSDLPVLYSFRRCPYAMRARLAILAAGQKVELREILLRDKAPEFLARSPSGTVPLLVLNDGKVIDESFDIMMWALSKSDPWGWLPFDPAVLQVQCLLVEEAETRFKRHLDRYKYESRYDKVNALEERSKASAFLMQLETQLQANGLLSGDQFGLADAAIAPFVRQFAHVDLDWFSAQDWPALIGWLEAFKNGEPFLSIMKKYPKWQAGDAVTLFP